jgi:hypothetical protein
LLEVALNNKIKSNQIKLWEKFEDTNQIIKKHKSMYIRYNGQRDKHYTENSRSSNTNPTNNRGWTQVFQKGSSSCFTCGTRRVTMEAHIFIGKTKLNLTNTWYTNCWLQLQTYNNNNKITKPCHVDIER